MYGKLAFKSVQSDIFALFSLKRKYFRTERIVVSSFFFLFYGIIADCQWMEFNCFRFHLSVSIVRASAALVDVPLQKQLIASNGNNDCRS